MSSGAALAPLDVVGAASQAFAAAAARHPCHERLIAPGGVPVRIRIAGELLARRLLAALPAHEPAAAPPVLTLEALDAAGTGVALPPSPWSPDRLLAGEEVAGATDGDVLAAIAPEHGTFSVIDRRTGRGAFLVRDAAAMPDWEDGSPLRHLLRWGLADHGLALVHAAAVGVPGGGGALLLGAGGAGKSTTALACLDAGLDVAADDYCLLGDDLRAHRIYTIGKLGSRSLELLPGIAGRTGPLRGPQRKAHVALGDRMAASVRVGVVVLPRVGSRTGPPRAVTAGEALRRVLPSTALQMPGRRAATVAALAGLLRRLPAVELPVGPDVRGVVAAVEDLCRAT